MPKDIWDAAVVVACLGRYFAIGELAAREYLTTLDDEDATLLWKCLRRLGWWLPDDQHSAQERLVWWLFRDDVTRLDFSDGTERRSIETSEERLREANQEVQSIARMATIQADSCLAVAAYVRALLRETGRNNPPLYGRCRRGWPSEFSLEDSGEGWREVTNDPAWLEDSRFNEFCFRFDGELLDSALSAAATRLNLPSGRLKLREATGDTLNDELYVSRDLVSWLESWRDGVMRAAWERQELPPGWEPNGETWPNCPIKTVEILRAWLSGWLENIHRARSNTWGSPELYLEDVQRELRNTRRAMRAWGVSLPPQFDDNPASIIEAEKQLELLIDRLGTMTSETPTPAQTASSLFTRDEPLTEQEFCLIDAEMRPEIRPALAAEVVTLLKTWPETWTAVDAENGSAIREEAIPLLVRRGLLEERSVFTVTDSMTGQSVRLLATVSGECQPAAQQQEVRKATPAEWWQDRTPSILFVDSKYRLSRHGFDCRAAINGVDPNQDVNDVLGWVFWHKMRGPAEPVVRIEPLIDRLDTTTSGTPTPAPGATVPTPPADPSATPVDERQVEGTPPKQLAQRFERAYRSYKWAESQWVNSGTLFENVTDEMAWEYLKNHGVEGYTPPDDFGTWQRYVREGREFYKDQKNSPRAGRTGGSIASADELELQRDDDAA